MSQTIQLRQENPEEEEKMAKLEEPDNDVYGYLSRNVADQLGEYMALTVSDEAEVTANFQKSTTNYVVFETPGGAVVGLGIHKSIVEDVHGIDLTGDEPDGAPESIGLAFAASTEDEWEEAEAVDEEEVEALIVGGGDDGDESEEEEEIVEISDEELDLVDAE